MLFALSQTVASMAIDRRKADEHTRKIVGIRRTSFTIESFDLTAY